MAASSKKTLSARQIDCVLEQMQTKGLSYDDFWSEYYDGTNTTYSWDADLNEYVITQIDIIVGSFFHTSVISRPELHQILLKQANAADLQEQGFDLDMMK